MIPTRLTSRPQWVCWRYQERDGKTTKVPWQLEPFRPASSTDPESWTTYAKAAQLLGSCHADGVGYVFTEDDGLIGIDLDDCIVGGMLLPWADQLIKQLNSYTEVSPSGNGIKIWVGGTWLGRGRKVKHPVGGAIEVYSSGRYFTVTGDELEFDGLKSHDVIDNQDGLDWMRDKYFAQDEAKPSLPQSPSSLMATEVIELARSAANGHKFEELFSQPPAKGQSEDHLALGSIVAFYTQDYATWLEVMRASAMSGHQKFEREDYLKRTFDRALQQSDRYEAPAEREARPAAPSGVWLGDLLANALGEAEASEPMPEWLIERAPEAVRLFFDYCRASYRYQVDEAIFLAAISAVATITSGKVAGVLPGFDPFAPNLFLLATAPSGGGKDNPRKAIKRILRESGASNRVGAEDPNSDSAIAELIGNQPQLVLLLDEFNRKLKQMADDGGGRSAWNPINALLRLYNEGTTPKMMLKAYADSKKNRELSFPCLNIFATGTEDAWQSINAEVAGSGGLGRFICYGSESIRTVKGIEDAPKLPGELVEIFKAWAEVIPRPGDGNLEPFVEGAPVQIGFTEPARKLLEDHFDAQQGRKGLQAKLLARGNANISRLALVAACSDFIPDEDGKFEGLCVSQRHAEWARDVICHCIEWTFRQLKDNLADNKQEREALRVKACIKASAQAGLTKTELTKQTKNLTGQQRNDILRTLIDAGEVVEGQRPARKRSGGGGRSFAACFWLTEFAQEGWHNE